MEANYLNLVRDRAHLKLGYILCKAQLQNLHDLLSSWFAPSSKVVSQPRDWGTYQGTCPWRILNSNSSASQNFPNLFLYFQLYSFHFFRSLISSGLWNNKFLKVKLESSIGLSFLHLFSFWSLAPWFMAAITHPNPAFASPVPWGCWKLSCLLTSAVFHPSSQPLISLFNIW